MQLQRSEKVGSLPFLAVSLSITVVDVTSGESPVVGATVAISSSGAGQETLSLTTPQGGTLSGIDIGQVGGARDALTVEVQAAVGIQLRQSSIL